MESGGAAWEKTAGSLAQAGDHLREPVAAGRPAGWAELGLAAGQAVGVYLLTVCAASFAVYAVVWHAVSSRPPVQDQLATARDYPGPPALWLGCGVVGMVLLGGCHLARRARRRRRPGRGEVPAAFYALVTAVFCVALTVALALVGRTIGLPHGVLPWAFLAQSGD